jgi:thiamine kinase-like enzyme
MAPPSWPSDGDNVGFFGQLIANTQRVYDESIATFGWLYDEIGVPRQPLESVKADAVSLTPRSFRLCHCDIHRKNVVLADRQTWFLDWEHALLGDPMYELAVHLHKMSYSPQVQAEFLKLAQECLDRETTVGLESDLALYLRHERMKSVIVDTVRYRKQATAPGADTAEVEYLAGKLATKTQASAVLWGSRSLSTREAKELLTVEI